MTQEEISNLLQAWLGDKALKLRAKGGLKLGIRHVIATKLPPVGKTTQKVVKSKGILPQNGRNI